MEYIFDIEPVAKPRMTQRDKWANRPIVTKYFGTCNLLKLLANKQGLQTFPEEIKGLTFFIHMPDSWSKKKKKEMDGEPHRQRPDLDNFLKFFQDALMKEDKHIWHISELSKRWSYEGKIILKI